MLRLLLFTGFFACIPGHTVDCLAADAIRVPVIRDTWFSAVGNEARCNLGGATKLKLKSIQEMSLVDIDPTPLAGRAVKRATLHLHLAGSEVLHRVTVGTFGAEWVEGTSSSYAEQKGSSTFAARQHPDVPWAEPGSDLTSVMLGQAGTAWRMADASPPDADGWQIIPVDPVIIAARVAGGSYGFILFDDTGTEWTRDGEKYTERMFPNRFVHSRESGEKTAPFFMIELGDKLPKRLQNLNGAGNGIAIVYPNEKPLGGDIPPELPVGGPLPRIGSAEIAIIDALDKVQPLTGEMIPQQPAEYFTRNHLWSATRKQVRLHAAKNEFTSFQIVVSGSAVDIQPVLTFAGDVPQPRVEFFRCRYVQTASGPLPDPLVPLTGSFSVPMPDEKLKAGQKIGSLICEALIPHGAAAGTHTGILTLKSAGEELKKSPSPGSLGLHAPRSVELSARNELLRLARKRTRLLPAGPPASDRFESSAVLSERQNGRWLRSSSGTASGWFWNGVGPNGLARTSTVRHSPICRGRQSPSSASTCRCTKTGRARLSPTTTAVIGPIRHSIRVIARRSSRRRGRLPNIAASRVGATRCFTFSSTANRISRRTAGRAGRRRGSWTNRPTFRITGPCAISARRSTRAYGKRTAARSSSTAATSRAPNGSATRSIMYSITTSWQRARSSDTAGSYSSVNNSSARSWSATAPQTTLSKATCNRPPGRSIRGWTASTVCFPGKQLVPTPPGKMPTRCHSSILAGRLD